MARKLGQPQWDLIDAAMRARGLYEDADLAEIVGVSGASVSRWRSGQSGIEDENLRALAAGLGIPYLKLCAPEEYAALEQSRATPERVEIDDEVFELPIRLEASAGRGASSRGGGVVKLAKSDVCKRAVLAVRITGRCMSPMWEPGDIVLFEKVADDQIRDGDKVLVTLLDDGENGAYLVKYLQWSKDNEHVILTAKDGTHLEVPYERLIIEGRYWRMQRD
jgi:transcriptional regulator with XRE-family HTH domain